MDQPRLALVSASDKTGLAELGRALAAQGYTILSTGGTAAFLRSTDLPVREVCEHTGFPEILDGRVKTLHPRVFGGILARRDQPHHLATLVEHEIGTIDVVVVNLYPFAATAKRADASLQDVIEEIDVGGPSLLRAAAKNHAAVAVVCDPRDYREVIAALQAGGIGPDLRRRLAAKAFAHTAAYDAAIAAWMSGQPGSATLALHGELVRELRYGENPHQKAAFFRTPDAPPWSIGRAELVSGDKELSYNNILDLDAALALVREFAEPCCAIVKHNNPCGAALGLTLAMAWEAALACDPQSAYGGIVASNVEVDRLAAQQLTRPGQFLEAIVAPAFADDALAVLRGAKFGKSLRLLRTGPLELDAPQRQVRSVSGGVLVQDEDAAREGGRSLDLKFVSKRRPTHDELRDLRFAWAVAKHVRSNSIVFAKGQATVGVGAGQMSRVDAVAIAARKAGERAKGAVAASDAFFPFADGLIAAAEAGVTAAIEPGGSMRDAEVIEAANARDVALVFTGVRHFKH